MNETPRQVAFLADVIWSFNCDLLPDAFPRRMGYAAAYLHLRAGHGLGFLEQVRELSTPIFIAVSFLLFFINIVWSLVRR